WPLARGHARGHRGVPRQGTPLISLRDSRAARRAFRPFLSRSGGISSASITVKGVRHMRRLLSFSLAALVLGLLNAPDASAQQSFNLYIGAFSPESLASRSTTDVLFQNSTVFTTARGNSNFDLNEFTGVSLGGEWLVGLGDHLEGSLGLGFY